MFIIITSIVKFNAQRNELLMVEFTGFSLEAGTWVPVPVFSDHSAGVLPIKN